MLRKKNSKDKKIVSEILLVIIVAIIVLSAVIVYAIYRLSSGYKDYENAEKIYANAQKEYVLISRPENASESEQVKIPMQTEDTESDPSTQNSDEGSYWYNVVNVNFDELCKVNSEVCGWLYFEDVDISYPIVQADNNDKYLSHDYTGATLRSGAIFMDCNNKSDFSDAHILIYGHNMLDMSMFGKLNYYKSDSSFYETHRYIQVITPDRKMRYMIVAYKDVPADGYIYTTYAAHDSGFKKFAENYIFKNSYIQSNVSISENDHIITLSTCSGNESTRFVVSAILVDEY